MLPTDLMDHGKMRVLWWQQQETPFPHARVSTAMDRERKIKCKGTRNEQQGFSDKLIIRTVQ